MRRRFLAVLVAVALVAAACAASGPSAPPVEGTEVVCNDLFCATYPQGWEVLEVGDTFIRFAHPADPERILASVGVNNLEALVVASGRSWPADAETAARAFWDLLAASDVGELVDLRRVPGGAIRSQGTYEGGRMWFGLVPTSVDRGIGVEMRAPNLSWEDHAAVFLDGVLPSG